MSIWNIHGEKYDYVCNVCSVTYVYITYVKYVLVKDFVMKKGKLSVII